MLGKRPTLHRLAAAGVALALVAAPAQAQNAAAPSAMEVDPANPFGTIDTNLWYLAQFLSGYQADAERWRWVASLSDGEKTEMMARCDRIAAEPERFSDDAALICVSVGQVLNQR